MNMKKIGIAIIGLLMAASSCQAAPWDFLFKDDKAETAQKENQQSEAYIRNRVQTIYADVRRNYPPDHGEPPRNAVDLDDSYCSTDWNRMVESVKEKDAKNKGEIGFFDADYWIMGQDWSDLTPVNIQVMIRDGSHAVVTFEMDRMGGDIKQVQLDMVYERGGWRIDNFIDRKNDLDWKQNMREYLAQ